MMGQRLHGWGYGQWGILLLVLACAFPSSLIGQGRGRPGAGGYPGDITRPSDGDPNDPGRQKEAAFRKASKYLEEGRQLLAKGKVGRAKTKFKAVIGIVGSEGPGQTAFQELMGIHNQGMAALGAARKLYEEHEYREAMKAAKGCKVIYANIFGGIKVAGNMPNVSKLAVALIKEINDDPEALIAFQEYEAAKRAKRIPGIERRIRKGRAHAYDLYKLLASVTKRYADCPTGQACHKKLKALKKDKKLWKRIKREEQRRRIASALRSIELYEKSGRHKEARAALQKLAKEHPGKSRRQLEKMASAKS